MDRTPPDHILMKLRQEVNFGCPYPDCGNPVLSWHHFDPPWSEKQHHDHEGMIALCPEHHAFADGGHYTREQLRKWKKHPNSIDVVRYAIPWFWENFVYEIGTSYSDPNSILYLNRRKLLQASRDDDKSPWKISIDLLNERGEVIAEIKDNFLIAPTYFADIHISYRGNHLKLMDKFDENYLDISIRTIAKDSIKSYLERIYKIAYKDSRIRHPDGTIEHEADNVEKMNKMVGNLLTLLQKYLNQDGNLSVVDINGKTGTRKFSLNYSSGKATLGDVKYLLRWGLGGDTYIRI